jgi:SAM-dependent methyltransferase
VLRFLISFAKRAVLGFTRIIGYRESEDHRIQQSSVFWNTTGGSRFQSHSHWRGEEGISDEVWLELGREHQRLFESFLKLTNLQTPLPRVVEWGCGGGANAIHFARMAVQYVGVDVSQASLTQCDKVLVAAGIENFVPVLVQVATPEDAIKLIKEPCDLFLCTYVFELLPSQAYAKRIVELAFQLLRPGGCAMIQIKYSTAESWTKPRMWGYQYNVANMTTFPIDGFWELAKEVGFEPLALTLQPRQELVGDERYAYFFLRRR